jgi:hypothetical protein
MSWQKQIGTAFEHQVKDRINTLVKGTDLTAVRIWYSGAGMREPFDVGIYRGEVRRENLVLQVEAKRTQGRSLGVQLKWLEQVSHQHVIMFAVGKRNPVPPYVIYPGGQGLGAMAAEIFKMKPAAKSVAIHERYVRKAGMRNCLIEARDKFYNVVDFDEYMRDRVLPKKEA